MSNPALQSLAHAAQATAHAMARLFLGLLLLLLLALGLALFSSQGGGWALKLAEIASHGAVQATGVQGGLLRPLQLEELRITTPAATVLLRKAQLYWQPSALLGRTLQIDSLSAASATLVLHPQPPSPFKPLPLAPPVTVELSQAHLGQLQLTTASGTVLHLAQLSASARWQGSTITLRRAAVVHPQWGAVGGAGSVHLQADALSPVQLALATPLGETAQLSGTLGLHQRASALRLQAQALRWPRSTQPQWQVRQLTLTAAGPLPLVALNLAAQLQGRPLAKGLVLPPLHLVASGQLQQGGLRLTQLQASPPGARLPPLQASGELRWQPALRINAQAQLRQFNPGLLLAEWPGALNGSLTASTQNNSVAFSAQLANSQLRGRPFALQLTGRHQTLAVAGKPPAQQLAFSQVQLRSGSAHLSGSGQVLPTLNVQAQLAATQLADLWPGLGGQLTASLTAKGALTQPQLGLNAQGQQLRLPGALQLASAKLQAQLDWQGQNQLQLHASGLQQGAQQAQQLELSLNGSLAQHQLSASLQRSNASLALGLAGGFSPKTQQWQGLLKQLALTAPRLPPMQLQAPAALVLSRTTQRLGNACLSSGEGASLCLSGNRQGTATQAHALLNALPISQLQALLPQQLHLASSASGAASVQLNGSQLSQAQLHLALSPGSLRYGSMPPLALQQALLTVQPQAGNWQAQLTAVTDKGEVSGELRLPQAGDHWPSKPLAGQLRIQVPSLAPFQALIPQIAGLSGTVAGQLQLAGLLGAPEISGAVNLSHGSLTIPAAGLVLTELTAQASGGSDGALQLVAQAQAGPGQLNAKGQLRYGPDGLTLGLALTGNNAQIANLPDARIWASPDLQLSYSKDGADLSGTVTIPKAEITPRKLAAGTVSESPDAVLEGREKPPPALRLNANVQLLLGDAVHFEGFGLNTRISGALTVRDAPGLATPRGRGELSLHDGKFKAYGQQLTLSSGRLLFAGGPLTDPTLDVVATRRLKEDLSVSVLVRGNPEALRLDLSSTQEMSREEQLSWLVLGRPLSSTTGAERGQMGAAALSLGFSGGEALVGRLGKSLGLDEVSLGSAPGDDLTQARLTVGKYLNPRLYVSYGLGLFERNNVFRLLYDLGHGFKLRTETGAQTGGDLLYTVER